MEGREALLPRFTTDRQAQRLEPETSAASLFLFLHGTLITETRLDAFAKVTKRLEDGLETSYVSAAADRDGLTEAHIRPLGFVGAAGESIAGDATWIRFAVISMGAILQYGSRDSWIKQELTAARDKLRKKKHTAIASTPSDISTLDSAAFPRIAGSGSSSGKRGETLMTTGSGSSGKTSKLLDDPMNADMRSLSIADAPESAIIDPPVETVDDDTPLRLRNAFSLASMLTAGACKRPLKPQGDDPAVNPYLTAMLTFFGTLCQTPSILAICEAFIPWDALVVLFKRIPANVRADMLNNSTRIFGSPLPEDWCIRGMDWTGRQLFGRGFWKSKFATGAVYESGGLGSRLVPEGEADVLDEHYEGPSMPAHAGGPAELLDPDRAADSGVTSTRQTVANLRWRRIAMMAAWLVRSGSGLVLDENTLEISIGADLQYKMDIWATGKRLPRDRVVHIRRASQGSSTVGSHGHSAPSVRVTAEPERASASRQMEGDKVQKGPDGASVEGSAAAPAPAGFREPIGSRAGSDANSTAKRSGQAGPPLVPGYSTLVLDTSVLLSSLDVFASLLETQEWVLVIPLAGESRNVTGTTRSLSTMLTLRSPFTLPNSNH